MWTPEQINALLITLFGAGGVGSILITDAIRTRKSKQHDPEPISPAEATAAVAESTAAAASEGIITKAEFRAVMTTMREQIEDLEIRVARAEQNAAAAKRHAGIAVRYAGSLREQVAGLGATPLSWPPELLITDSQPEET